MYKHPQDKRAKKVFRALALTRKILVLLAGYDGSNVRFYDYGLRQWTREDREYARAAQIKRAMYNLKARKYIEIRKVGDKMVCVLTNKGKLAALKDQIRLSGISKDGRVLLVSFDIPEQEHVARSKLRFVLKDCGFERIQHSLWGSKQNVGDKIAKLIKDTGAQRWVRIFSALEIIAKKSS